jgi:hypothetical protein
LKRNQFGFTLGGPFMRTSCSDFGGYQKLTIRQAPGNLRDLTLTAAERRGDFSGNPIALFDPRTNGQRFPGNIIPAARFSRAAVKLLTFSPLPIPMASCVTPSRNQRTVCKESASWIMCTTTNTPSFLGL